MARRRLDVELVRRGLARSREHATQFINEGRVKVSGGTATKPATQVDVAAAIVVDSNPDEPRYVSRGAYKLQGALAEFCESGFTVAGRRCLDAGASTGGFTEVLLLHGASEVVAVDVGYGQLAWSLQQDTRVHIHDRTNVRSITQAMIGGAVDVVVADLSFISLSLVLDALVTVCRSDADLLVMVKPQFEVGKERLGAGGVVRDPALRVEAVRKIAARGVELGVGVRGVTASPLPGPAGNVEYFLWFRADAHGVSAERLGDQIEQAVAKGPT